MSGEQRYPSEWHQLFAKMENKIRIEESLAVKQREESAISLRQKQRECDSLRDQLKRVIEMGQRLTSERDIAVDDKKKLQKEMSELRDKNGRLERRVKALETELRPENRQKRVENIRNRVVASLQLSADTEPLSVFANHSRGVHKHSNARKYAITVQNPLLDKAHTFYQFNADSFASDLYKAVSDHFGINEFELASLVYNKIETHSNGRSRKLNVGDRTLGQNNLFHDMHAFIIDPNMAPQPGQLFHVMMGKVTHSQTPLVGNAGASGNNNNQLTRKTAEQKNIRDFKINVDRVGPQRISNLNREAQRSLKPYSSASNISDRNIREIALNEAMKPFGSVNQRINPQLLDTHIGLRRSLNPFQDNDYRTDTNAYPTRKTVIY